MKLEKWYVYVGDDHHYRFYEITLFYFLKRIETESLAKVIKISHADNQAGSQNRKIIISIFFHRLWI